MTDLQKDVAVYKLGIVKQSVHSQIRELEASVWETPEYNTVDHDDGFGFSVTVNGSITVSHVAVLEGETILVKRIKRDVNA